MNGQAPRAPFGWLQWSSQELVEWSGEIERQLELTVDPMDRELLTLQLELMDEVLDARSRVKAANPRGATVLPFRRSHARSPAHSG